MLFVQAYTRFVMAARILIYRHRLLKRLDQLKAFNAAYLSESSQ